jgi:hypothetical protein
VAPFVGRGVSGVSHLGQYPGGGALWFVPLIRCKNHTAGDGQRVRVALLFGRGVSVPVRVVSGRSGDIRTSFSNKCSKVKTATFSGLSCQNFQPNPDRISNRILTESQPNLDRISESLSLAVQPNPNRISKSSQRFYFVSGLLPRRALQDL